MRNELKIDPSKPAKEVNFPDIDDSPKKSKKLLTSSCFKSNGNFDKEERNSKILRKLTPITNSFSDNINDINNKINDFDVMRKHYYGEDAELSKKKIQQVLREENYFFREDENNKNSLAMKYLYYPNVGLSTSQSLMRAMTTFSRGNANEKIYNAPDRSKFEKKLFLKDVMKRIMFDLKPVDVEEVKKFLKDEKKIEELIKRNYDQLRRISMFVKTRTKNEKNDINEFENMDLMHELRGRMLSEFKTPSKYLTGDQKSDKLREIRDQFLPEKKKNLLETKKKKQKELKKHEMTSKKSINNVYYQIVAMNKKDKEKFKNRIIMSSSEYSRFLDI